MSWMNADLDHRMELLRRQALRQDADKWRMLHAGRRPAGWLSKQRCRLLCQVGRWLVRWGRMLQNQGHTSPRLAGTWQ